MQELLWIIREISHQLYHMNKSFSYMYLFYTLRFQVEFLKQEENKFLLKAEKSVGPPSLLKPPTSQSDKAITLFSRAAFATNRVRLCQVYDCFIMWNTA